MLRKSQHKGFDLEVHSSQLRVGRGSVSIPFTPGQGPTLVALLAVAQRLRSLPIKPPQISNDSFEVQLSDGGLRISGRDQSSPLEISWLEVDALQEAVENAIRVSNDVLTLEGRRPVIGGVGELDRLGQ